MGRVLLTSTWSEPRSLSIPYPTPTPSRRFDFVFLWCETEMLLICVRCVNDVDDVRSVACGSKLCLLLLLLLLSFYGNKNRLCFKCHKQNAWTFSLTDVFIENYAANWDLNPSRVSDWAWSLHMDLELDVGSVWSPALRNQTWREPQQTQTGVRWHVAWESLQLSADQLGSAQLDMMLSYELYLLLPVVVVVVTVLVVVVACWSLFIEGGVA